MASPETLLDDAGHAAIFEEGASADIVATFKNMAGTQLTEANIVTLTLTLYDRATKAVINSRNAQDVKDANGGVLASDGTLTMKLGPLDNIITGHLDQEDHIARFTWTWSDGITRTGVKELLFRVANLPSVS